MDLGRVCEIYALPRSGSGFLIADGLVLTAAHVVGDVGARVQVRMFGGHGEIRDADVVWAGGTRVDAAVLRLCEGETGASGVSPVRWGQLVGSSPGVACEATGFPEAMVAREPDGTLVRRDLDQICGTINPLSRRKARLLDATVTSAAPAPEPSDVASRWGGMSGAALWCSGLLTGVIVQDPSGFASRRLTAVPVAEFLADAEFARLVGAAAGAAPVPEPVELAGLQVPRWPLVTPTSLLRADTAVVRFSGREQLLEELETAWCAAPGRLSARLLAGPAGSGKSRLARQLGERLAAGGWAIVHLAEEPAGATPDEARYAALADLRCPLFLIIDYAETRRPQIMRLARYLTGDRPAPVRVLLIARTGGEWWAELAASSPGLAWLSPEIIRPISVPPLVDPGRRVVAFTEAVAGLATALPRLPEERGLDWPALAVRIEVPDLSTDRYASILSVQTAALAALLTMAHGGGDVIDAAADAVLLDHEARYWNKLAEARGVRLPDADRIRRGAVTTATACGAASADEAHDTITRVPGFGDQPEALRRAAAVWLRDLYPLPGTYWGRLEPDRLAEYLAGKTLSELPSLLDQALAAASTDQAYRALTLLSRAALAHRHLAPIITRTIVGHPDTLGPAAVVVSVETEDPTPLLAALDVLLAQGPPSQLLARLLAAIPRCTQVHQDRAAKIAGRLAAAARAADDKARGRGILTRLRRRSVPATAALARSLADLSFRLSRVGQDDEALDVTKEEVKLARWLARKDPGEFTDDLAGALSTLGGAHARTGGSTRALEATREAVGHFRRLARSDSATHLPELAESLADLRDRLAEANRTTEALKATGEVVKVYRRLAANDPETFTPRLAEALSIQGTTLAEAGRRKRAAAVAGEATKLYQRLAEAQPDAFNPYLADAFLILGGALGAVGKPELAREASQQSVEVAQRLVEVNPEAFAPVQARAVANLGVVLAAAGDWAQAETRTREAIALYRPLVAGRSAFTTELADTLQRYSGLLMSFGRVTESQAAIREAIGLSRPGAAAPGEPLLGAFIKEPAGMTHFTPTLLPADWIKKLAGAPGQSGRDATMPEFLIGKMGQGQSGLGDQGKLGQVRWGGLNKTQLGGLDQGRLGGLRQTPFGKPGSTGGVAGIGGKGDDDPPTALGPTGGEPTL